MPLMDMKTALITEKGQIAIPKAIREREGFGEGAKIAILAFENRIELIPLAKFNEKMFPALASEKSLAKEWLTREEDQAWKNL